MREIEIPLQRCVSVLAAALVSIACAPAALAHAALVKSEPARRAALTRPPAHVRLWFNEKIEPAYATIHIARDGVGPLTHQPARVAKDDPKLLVLELPALGPGSYTVKYRVLSVDGHSVESAYVFSVKKAAGSK